MGLREREREGLPGSGAEGEWGGVREWGGGKVGWRGRGGARLLHLKQHQHHSCQQHCSRQNPIASPRRFPSEVALSTTIAKAEPATAAGRPLSKSNIFLRQVRARDESRNNDAARSATRMRVAWKDPVSAAQEIHFILCIADRN